MIITNDSNSADSPIPILLPTGEWNTAEREATRLQSPVNTPLHFTTVLGWALAFMMLQSTVMFLGCLLFLGLTLVPGLHFVSSTIAILAITLLIFRKVQRTPAVSHNAGRWSFALFITLPLLMLIEYRIFERSFWILGPFISLGGLVGLTALLFTTLVMNRNKRQTDSVKVTDDIGLLTAIAWIILMVIAEAIICTVAMVVLRLYFSPEDLLACLFSLITFTNAAFAILLMRVRLGSTARQVLAIRWPRPVPLLLVLLLTYPLGLLSTELSTRASEALGRSQPSATGTVSPMDLLSKKQSASAFDLLDQMYEADMKLPLLLALIVGALLPAVGEEILFRGLIGRGLVAHYGTLFGVLLTSLLFALVHADPVRIAVTFFLGLVLHAIYLATRSLIASMVLHATYNSFCIACYKVGAAYQIDLTATNDAGHISASMFIASVVIIAALLAGLFRIRSQWLMPEGTIWSTGFVTAEAPPREVQAKLVGNRLGITRTLGLMVLLMAFVVTAISALQISRHRHLSLRAQIAGYELFNQGDYQGAIRHYTEAIALDAALRDAYINRAGAYISLDRYAEANADFDMANRLKPNAADVRTEWSNYFSGQAESALQQEDYATALQFFNRSLAIVPGDADITARRAWVLMRLGRIGEARLDYDSAARLNPALNDLRKEWVSYYKQLAEDALDREDCPAALIELNKTLELETADVPALRLRAYVYETQSQWKTAIRDYTMVLQLQPDDEYAITHRGRCHLCQKDYDAALADYNHAIKIRPGIAEYYMNRGLAHAAKKDSGKAIVDFETVVGLNPGMARAHNDLAYHLLTCPDEKMRDATRALRHAAKANELTKGMNPRYLELLASAHAATGDYKEAFSWQRKALSLGYPDAALLSKAQDRLKFYESKTPQ